MKIYKIKEAGKRWSVPKHRSFHAVDAEEQGRFPASVIQKKLWQEHNVYAPSRFILENMKTKNHEWHHVGLTGAPTYYFNYERIKELLKNPEIQKKLEDFLNASKNYKQITVSGCKVKYYHYPKYDIMNIQENNPQLIEENDITITDISAKMIELNIKGQKIVKKKNAQNFFIMMPDMSVYQEAEKALKEYRKRNNIPDVEENFVKDPRNNQSEKINKI